MRRLCYPLLATTACCSTIHCFDDSSLSLLFIRQSPRYDFERQRQNACRPGTDRNDDNTPVTAREASFLDRRSFLTIIPPGILSSVVLFGDPVSTTANQQVDDKKISQRLSPFVLRSLKYERILGAGSYKTVYLVSSTIVDDDDTTHTVRYALAVERLRTKRDVKNAFRGILIPESIRQALLLENSHNGELFESVVDWWLQPSNLPEFAEGRLLFPELPLNKNLDKALGRSRSEPGKNFAGSRWMLSFKPVYETDLKRFIQKSPVLYPIGGGWQHESNSSHNWTESEVLTFVLEVFRAGKLMHASGIVHRDIKPKNTMMFYSESTHRRRPILIDFGFAEGGSLTILEKDNHDLCVVRPGQLKGEADYVLAEDLANYRGCQRGDTYAMGKTLYEFVFGSAELQTQDPNNVISVEAAEVQNKEFRNLLLQEPTESRFYLSREAADCLLSILRGLCGDESQRYLTFAEAEAILSDFLSGPANTS